jgi:hypothetical protein
MLIGLGLATLAGLVVAFTVGYADVAAAGLLLAGELAVMWLVVVVVVWVLEKL